MDGKVAPVGRQDLVYAGGEQNHRGVGEIHRLAGVLARAEAGGLRSTSRIPACAAARAVPGVTVLACFAFGRDRPPKPLWARSR